jgi:hypothetical protein
MASRPPFIFVLLRDGCWGGSLCKATRDARMNSTLVATTVATFGVEVCIYRLSELLRELLNEISWCHKSARG